MLRAHAKLLAEKLQQLWGEEGRTGPGTQGLEAEDRGRERDREKGAGRERCVSSRLTFTGCQSPRIMLLYPQEGLKTTLKTIAPLEKTNYEEPL